MSLFEIETNAHIMIAWADDRGKRGGDRKDSLSGRRDPAAHQAASRHLGNLKTATRHRWELRTL